MDKNFLRKWAIENRTKYIDSEKLVQALKNSEIYKISKNIMIFYPLKSEVNLLSLLEDKTKNFYLPRVSKDNLSCCPYICGDDLCLSRYNVYEPLTPECNKNIIDLVVVPALCCDVNNYRLGYGGGFYDRFLKDFSGKKVVCLPKALIVKTVYPDEYDVPVDLVITECNC